MKTGLRRGSKQRPQTTSGRNTTQVLSSKQTSTLRCITTTARKHTQSHSYTPNDTFKRGVGQSNGAMSTSQITLQKRSFAVAPKEPKEQSYSSVDIDFNRRKKRRGKPAMQNGLVSKGGTSSEAAKESLTSTGTSSSIENTSFPNTHRLPILTPDDEVLNDAFNEDPVISANGKVAVLNYFRTASRQSHLVKQSRKVDYNVAIDGTSATEYPIDPFLLHTLYSMSDVTATNRGVGMAAPQFGVNYRMLVLRSEMFGLTTPITSIPYVLQTSEEFNCDTPPYIMKHSFNAFSRFGNRQFASPLLEAQYDGRMRPKFNLNECYLDVVDNGCDDAYINSIPGSIKYPLTREKPIPQSFQRTLSQCDDKYIFDEEGMFIPDNSFIHSYNGYNLTIREYDEVVYTNIVQSFNQGLMLTPILNPRIVGIRNEYLSMREGCFTFPQWTANVRRPIAVDIEYETLLIDGSVVPLAEPGCADSAFMSTPLMSPFSGSTTRCPSPLDSNVDMDYIHEPSTKQLLIPRRMPPPSAFQLVTRKATVRDLFARLFLHEYDHLDGISFTDRCDGKYLFHQPPFLKPKAKPRAHVEYPVNHQKIYL